PPFSHDAREHFLGLGEELARGLPYDRILQDLRVRSGELPRLEEWRPVNVADQLRERIVAHHRHARLARPGRDVGFPIRGMAEASRFRDGMQRPGTLLVAMLV